MIYFIVSFLVLVIVVGLFLFYKSRKNVSVKSTNSSYTGFSLKIKGKDKQTLIDLETQLLSFDVGVESVKKVIENLDVDSEVDIPAQLKDSLSDLLVKDRIFLKDDNFDKVKVILVSGVNGVGKTTTIGKIANILKAEGKNILLIPADTFRAAASSQLGVWAARANVDILDSKHEDPAALAYEGIEKATGGKYDYVIIDTAGRLHTKKPLMEQLSKVERSISKAGGVVVESLLVIDATTGQNGIRQADSFFSSIDLTGLIVTKLDGSSKGGIVFALEDKFKIPVKLVGTGESIENIEVFDPDKFINSFID